MGQFGAVTNLQPRWLERMKAYLDQGQAETAYQELERAARSGDHLAMVMLGDVFEANQCGLGDPARAAGLYADAADKGNSLGQLYLAYLYETGNGVEKNLDKARDLYRQALLYLWLPDDELWTTVYEASMGRRGVTPLMREQRQWLKNILSNPESALALSNDYLSRRPPKGRLACRLLILAAPQTEAIYVRLAQMHMNGLGIARNSHNARVFSHWAAKAGSKEAHYWMGILLLEEQPEHPARMHALVWLLRARDLGVAIDETYLRQARSSLSADETRLAEDWAKSPPPPLPRIYGYDRSQPVCAISD